MTFNSYYFVFVFLPISFLGFFVLNNLKKYKFANIFLVVMSSFFFAFSSWQSLLVVWFSMIANYLIILQIKRKKMKLILYVSIALNVGVLLYLKYWNFFLDNINTFFESDISNRDIFIPLGISYFTFQQIAFLVDNYRNEVTKFSFDEYCLYICFFPKVMAGPILLHNDFFPQLRNKNKRNIDYDNISKGLYAFSVGMAKKVIIADKFGELVDIFYANLVDMNTTSTLVAMIGFTFQLYFDFSGYCDMGIGICRLFNIELPVNFNSPYKAYTISEFWDRWHISLTRFFTKYIYIPLGGSRGGNIKTCVNIMIVFLISGLWHGAAWTFIIWGALHGVISVVNRVLKKQIERWNRVFSWIITFTCVNIAWVFFRANNINEAKTVIWKLLELDFGAISSKLVDVFDTNQINILLDIFHASNYTIDWIHLLLLVCFYIVAFTIILNFKNINEQIMKFSPSLVKCIFSAFILVWSILSFSSVSTFLYSGF